MTQKFKQVSLAQYFIILFGFDYPALTQGSQFKHALKD
jgi:hypothetical protein